VAEELTIGFLIPAVALELSALSVLEGRAKEALNLVPEARVAIEKVGLRWWEVLAELRMSEALFAAGRVDEARIAAARTLDLARKRGEQGQEAWALRLLGEINAHPRATAIDTAEGHYRQALVLAERLDMRPLVAHCHLGLGKLYCRLGERELAQEHLTTATAMYREMGMGFYLAQAETQLNEST
jgi:ATP/maltotriose-dependent transcriptional regulator MalT